MTSNPPPASVLVYVGLDRVGDGLLKLPFVRGLRQAFPEARITWLAGKETSVYAGVMAPLVEGLLDEVVEYGGVGLEPAELLRRPFPGRFDLIIDTQKIVWTSLSLWRTRHKRFISPSARFLFSSARPGKNYKFPKNMQRQLLDLLELATGRDWPTPERLDLPLGDGLFDDARALLPDGPRYLGFAPGSGGRPKCWPLERFISIAQQKAAAGLTPVFLIGPQETEWIAPLRDAVPGALFPLQADGIEEKYRFSPLFTIALSGRLSAALSNDSGVGHMLAIGGAPICVMYGPTVPEKFLPMGQRVTIIRAADFGGREMSLIPEDVISREVDALLG